MQSDLRRAIDAIHGRFGDQALVRATRLPDVQPWPTGLGAVDRLSRIGGLPRGRVSVLQGQPGSGKLSLGLDLLAHATRELSQVVVLDLHRGFDPWILRPPDPDLSALAVVRPPNPAAAGEAAVALARAGTSFLLVLGPLLESALAPLESAAAHSSCAVVAIDEGSDRALAHASSLTIGFQRIRWVWDRDLLVGLRARLACLKNKLEAPGATAELEMRYAQGGDTLHRRTGKRGERNGRGRAPRAVDMAGPVCCGLIPHLELALHPELYGQPVVVARFGDRVTTASEEATSHGVLAGMMLRKAKVLSPAVAVVEPQPEAACRLRERIAAALYDLVPVVEVRLDGLAWLDLDGVPRTGQAVREVRRRLRDAACAEPRLGMAPGPFTAALAAARARPGRLLMVAEARPFLAPLAVEELPLDAEQLERLDLLGLRSLGQVAAIGPRRLESQLGKVGREAVLLAQGEEPRPLTPWRPPKVVGARRQLEPPVEDREALLFIARGLIDDLAAELGLRGAGAKRVRVLLQVEGVAEAERRESLVRHPLSSSAELLGLVGSWLRQWQPAAAVTEVAIELPELEAAGRRQLRLWRGADGSVEEVEAALERLQERYGEEVALRVRSKLLASPLAAQRYALVPK